ncbi:MAG: SMC-Scp complex subunit ScpB [Candidatus Omnitrophica bacterium]|nr:SMC-Scp complex subunit ScpB [Candidatus Omnitrophota bacterium]
MPTALEEKQKERERELKMKEMRREIEAEILEKIPTDAFESRPTGVEQYEEIKEVDFPTMKKIVEALLFVAHKPLTMNEIKKVIKGYKSSEIDRAVQELKTEYESRDSSFRLQEIAGGYELSTHPQFAPWIMKMELDKRARQATQAALETLAILAYKQPVTRVEIEEIRGVDVSGVISTLMDRTMIKIVGRKEIPGRPLLYGTTDKFLEHFGLKSLEELPKIDEIKELVARMVNREEQAEAEKTQPTQIVDAIPSAAERERVLNEVTDLLKNTKIAVIPAPSQNRDDKDQNL